MSSARRSYTTDHPPLEFMDLVILLFSLFILRRFYTTLLALGSSLNQFPKQNSIANAFRYTDPLIYLVKCFQIDTAIENPVQIALWDKVSQAENCPCLNHSNLPSILLHLDGNKAMYV